MPSPNYTSDNAFDTPALPLDIDFLDGTTVFNMEPSVNQFLTDENGPFTSLCEQVKENTEFHGDPTPKKLPPLTEIVCNIAHTLYGQMDTSKQADIGDILVGAGIDNDLSFQGMYIFTTPMHHNPPARTHKCS